MSTIKSLYPAAPATKRCLLLTAHGSRRGESNDEIRRLTSMLEQKTANEFGLVLCAFLELAAPSIPQGIQACIDKGATDIIILPYFLSAGRHVAEDIPAIVEHTQRIYPQINFKIMPYLGALQGVVDLLAYCACSSKDFRQYSLCSAR